MGYAGLSKVGLVTCRVVSRGVGGGKKGKRCIE